jgi:hypothetical protein
MSEPAPRSALRFLPAGLVAAFAIALLAIGHHRHAFELRVEDGSLLGGRTVARVTSRRSPFTVGRPGLGMARPAVDWGLGYSNNLYIVHGNAVEPRSYGGLGWIRTTQVTVLPADVTATVFAIDGVPFEWRDGALSSSGRSFAPGAAGEAIEVDVDALVR